MTCSCFIQIWVALRALAIPQGPKNSSYAFLCFLCVLPSAGCAIVSLFEVYGDTTIPHVTLKGKVYLSLPTCTIQDTRA